MFISAFSVCRKSREAPSSPSSTSLSMPAACCPPSSPPSWKVRWGHTHSGNRNGSVTHWCVNVCVCVVTAQECGIYSHQQCYPLAFGVPAALMFVALGTRTHTLAAHKPQTSPSESLHLYVAVFKVVSPCGRSCLHRWQFYVHQDSPSRQRDGEVLQVRGRKCLLVTASGSEPPQQGSTATDTCCPLTVGLLSAVCSLPSKTASGTVLLSTRREPTGWTGLRRSMTWVSRPRVGRARQAAVNHLLFFLAPRNFWSRRWRWSSRFCSSTSLCPCSGLSSTSRWPPAFSLWCSEVVPASAKRTLCFP